MKNEFQSLALDIFSPTIISEAKFVYGGAATSAPNGGCTCDTTAGGVAGGTYTSDTQSYNSNGSINTTDYQGWVANS